MTTVTAPVRRPAAEVASCSRCDDTGHRPEDGTACTCDARPFEAGIVDRQPVAPEYRCHRPPTVAQSVALTELELVIDRALMWSSSNLAAVVRLAHWQPYLRSGGVPSHALDAVQSAAQSIEVAAGDVAELVAELQRLASDVAEGAE